MCTIQLDEEGIVSVQTRAGGPRIVLQIHSGRVVKLNVNPGLQVGG